MPDTTYTTLISAIELQALMHQGRPLMVFDCSFDLSHPTLGAQQYLQSRIIGAVYADLERHLSAQPDEGDAASGGRHPLPARERFAAWLSRIGFANHMQAVVYDRNACTHCPRLWWMLKWAGHEAVAVLDGGLQAWQAAGAMLAGSDSANGDRPGHDTEGSGQAQTAAAFTLHAPLREWVSAQQVLDALGHAGQTVIDARAAPRYRGEVEPLDPVAGHIPGALNRPFGDNFNADGRFKSASTLRAEFTALLQGRSPSTVVHQCGSGVTAIPNVLAMEIAGLGKTRLFAGSWSEWCSDPARPVERG